METLKFKKGTSSMLVVNSIRQKAFDPDHFGSMDNYIDWLRHDLWRFSGIGVDVKGETTEERADSLVSELQRHGLISFC